MSPSSLLTRPIDAAEDGEGNRIEFDYAYAVKLPLVDIVAELHRVHGPAMVLLPISGRSAGGGIFQQCAPGKTVIGLQFEAPLQPRISCARVDDLARIGLDEIIIDRDRHQICAGSSVTLDQLNRALASELGFRYRVLGADLTSYGYAAAGATFMTGGMGPQRRYFSDSVVEIAVFDGNDIKLRRGKNLDGYAGTYGWSGIVSALRCRYHHLPQNEIAFAIPVSNTPAQLARLLAKMADYCFLDLQPGTIGSLKNTNGIILGLEHVTTSSMDPLLKQSIDNEASRRAQQLKHTCVESGADGLIFVNGFSDEPIDDFVTGLVDDDTASELTIAGIDLAHTEIFADAEEMRMLREAIPYAARTQRNGEALIYKNHTDANIRLDPQKVQATMTALWQINCDYVASIKNHFQHNPGIDGDILVYGHLNPYGVDPHNRVTMGASDSRVFKLSRDYLIAQRDDYYRELGSLCERFGAQFIGGEKSADSEKEIYRAFGGSQFSPPTLAQRFLRQRARVREASLLLNWRAEPPYR